MDNKIVLVKDDGVLELVHPQPGQKFYANAEEYSRIDFSKIVGQWQFLQIHGHSLLISFDVDTTIELLNFFDSEISNWLLVQIDDATYITPALFVQKFVALDGVSTSGQDSAATTPSGAYFVDPLPLLSSSDLPDLGLGSGLLPDEHTPSNLPFFPSPPAPPPLPPGPLPPSNSAPAITGADAFGAVVEDVLPPAGTGVVAFKDSDLADLHNVSVTPVGGGYLGTFAAVITDSATGDGSGEVTWNFSVDNATLQFLAADQQLTQTYLLTIDDGAGGAVTQNVTIAVTGANDLPEIAQTDAAGGVEEGPLPAMVATGTIDFADVDLADNHIVSVTPQGTGYLGVFTAVVSDGSTGDGVGQVTWLFAANNELRQSVGAGEVLVQTYTVEIDDGHGGTATQLVTITINGTNDAATITGETTGTVVEDGGINNTTPGTPTDAGDLDATDVDNPSDTWQAVAAGAATTNGYGTYALDAAGVWTYTLDNSNAVVQALNGSATLTDSFTALTADGTAQLVTVTIAAQNDAAVITGDATGAVTEAGGINNSTPGTPTDTGDLNSTDVDNPSDTWQAVAAGAATTNGYGTYALDAAGVWTYTLDNSNTAVQALNGSATLTDSFTALTADGTAQLVTITINGANDAAVISGDTSGAVIEAGGVANGTPGTPFVTGAKVTGIIGELDKTKKIRVFKKKRRKQYRRTKGHRSLLTRVRITDIQV